MWIKGWRTRYSELGGGAWPLGSPSRPNLGFSFPWPCPPVLGASGRGGGALRRCPRMPPCRGLLCLTSLSQCLSRSSSLGPPLWLGARACLCLNSWPHACLYFSVSLPMARCPRSLSQLCLSFLGPVILSPSLRVRLRVGLIAHPSLLS